MFTHRERNTAQSLKKILPFVTMNPEGITLSEISYTGKDDLTCMWNLKNKKPNPQIQRTDRWLPEVGIGGG